MRSRDSRSSSVARFAPVLAAAFIAGSAAFGGFSFSNASAEESVSEPSVGVPDQAWNEGEAIPVTAQGFPPGVIAVSVCGQNAERGSADCNLASSTTLNVGPDSRGTGEVTSVLPGPGCPCVVRAVTLDGSQEALAPLRLAGIPDTPRAAEPAPEPEAEPELPTLTYSALAELPMDTRSVLMRAVGGPTTVELAVTVRNGDDIPDPGSTFAVVVGRNTMSGDFATEIEVGALQPGEQIVQRFTIELSAPTWGVYTLHGQRDSSPLRAEPLFETTVRTWPITAIALVGAVIAVAVARSRSKKASWWAVGLGLIGTLLLTGILLLLS